MFTLDAEGFITEGIFTGLHADNARDIEVQVHLNRQFGWPEEEVIVLRDNEIRATLAVTTALRAELA